MRAATSKISLLSAVLAAVALLIGSADVEAKGRRKKKAPPANEKALAELRGPFDFGMTRKQVYKVLKEQITEKYAEKISGTFDISTQDRLRKKRKAELKKIQKSHIFFKGKKTGWEGSIVQDQFRHKAGESMMVFWEQDPVTGKDQRRFFFFHNGRLYKMFVALNSDNLQPEQRKFAFLKSIMERRFGKGKVGFFKTKKANVPKSIEWQTKKYRAFAVDNMEVFGAFCLAIVDRNRETKLLAVRSKLPKGPKGRAIIRNLVDVDGKDDPTLDEGNQNVIDDILK